MFSVNKGKKGNRRNYKAQSGEEGVMAGRGTGDDTLHAPTAALSAAAAA